MRDLLRLAELAQVARVVRALEAPGCPRLRVVRVLGCWLVVEGEDTILHQGSNEVEALDVADWRVAELLTPSLPDVQLRRIDNPAAKLTVDGRVISANRNLKRLLGEALALEAAHYADPETPAISVHLY